MITYGQCHTSSWCMNSGQMMIHFMNLLSRSASKQQLQTASVATSTHCSGSRGTKVSNDGFHCEARAVLNCANSYTRLCWCQHKVLRIITRKRSSAAHRFKDGWSVFPYMDNRRFRVPVKKIAFDWLTRNFACSKAQNWVKMLKHNDLLLRSKTAV